MMRSLYQSLFDSIDVDNSGTIEASELFTAMRKAFPSARFTPADAIKMLEEADTNDDGVLSFDEFVSIMQNAEGIAGNWAKLNQSFFQKGLKSIRDVGVVAHSAVRPFREFARQHSFDWDVDKDIKIASVGLRFGAEIVFGLIVLVSSALLC
jgi:hypothetical protein